MKDELLTTVSNTSNFIYKICYSKPSVYSFIDTFFFNNSFIHPSNHTPINPSIHPSTHPLISFSYLFTSFEILNISLSVFTPLRLCSFYISESLNTDYHCV
jgi:hypothetical protein